MKKSEAILLAQQIQVAFIKTRSNMLDGILDPIEKETIIDMFPGILGERGDAILRSISKAADLGDKIEPINIYNLCAYCTQLQPVVAAIAAAKEIYIPEPNPSMLHWDPEESESTLMVNGIPIEHAHNELTDEIKRLKDLLKRAFEVIDGTEYDTDNGFGDYFCGSCGRYAPENHTPECKKGILMEEIKKEII